MTLLKTITKICCLSFLFTACSLDNYQAPAGSLHGKFIDKETGELIEQDIIRGTQIEYQEGRFTANQYVPVKTDGSYYKNQMFHGIYRVTPVRGNFEPVETAEIEIKGDTEYNFEVIPFLRIKGVSIFKNGNKVRAMFKIEQTGYDNVLKVGLYAGSDKSVGATVFQSGIEQPVGSLVGPEQSFIIELDILNNAQLKKGKTYYFRVGAVIDAPEAKFNYAPAVELAL